MISEGVPNTISLPIEMWGTILRWLPPSKGVAYVFDSNEKLEEPQDDEALETLLSAGLVCHTFRDLVQPLIFHRFYLEASFISEEDLVELLRSVEKFIHLLEAKPEIAPYFTIFDVGLPIHLYSSYGDVHCDWSEVERLSQMTQSVLRRLPSLRTIGLSAAKISPRILEPISSKTSLQTLKLENIMAEDAGMHALEQTLESTLVTKVTIRAYHSDSSPHPPIELPRTGFLMFGASLTHLDTDMRIILANGISRLPAESWNLVDLTLTVDDNEIVRIPQVLERLPSLTGLGIKLRRSWRENATIESTPRCVPSLAEFRGPFSIAACLIPARPVRKVFLERVGLESSIEDTLALLKTSAAEVEELTVKTAVSWSSQPKLREVGAALRGLRRLEIVIGSNRTEFLDDIKDFISSKSVLPRLEEIRWGTLVSSTGFQAPTPELVISDLEWLLAASNSFPSLKVFASGRECWNLTEGQWTKSFIAASYPPRHRVHDLRQPR